MNHSKLSLISFLGHKDIDQHHLGLWELMQDIFLVCVIAQRLQKKG